MFCDQGCITTTLFVNRICTIEPFSTEIVLYVSRFCINTNHRTLEKTERSHLRGHCTPNAMQSLLALSLVLQFLVCTKETICDMTSGIC